jgi:preprotein translocase subunit SecF
MASTSVLRRLYRGETRFDFIGHRRWWYYASAVIILISLLSFVFRGFNIGVEFEGGTQYQIEVTNTKLSTHDVEQAFIKNGATPADAAQLVGNGSTKQVVIKFGTQTAVEQSTLIPKVASALKVPVANISDTSVSSSWGSDITKKAIEGLIIFLIVVTIYISIRFEWRMAAGALVALLHDLLVAAGVYSLVGFEVTPSTVVGLLTILGFSLYDTVVVYDKVAENTKDILATSRATYSEAANLAVNQTLMRSFNTSLIALLPVAGLLFVGSLILGVGTIKDLALILFVGLASGAYSSLFLATPVVCELAERQPVYQAQQRRVAARRATAAKSGVAAEAASPVGSVATVVTPAVRRSGGGAPAPRPGARPQRRPGGSGRK